MANLLSKYGIKLDLEKAFSISFIDDFVDCSYRTFLSKFIGIRRDVSLNKIFGSAVHAGLQTINTLLKDSKSPCDSCPHSCKLTSESKSQGALKTVAECPVQQAMNSAFYLNFTPEQRAEILADIVDTTKRTKTEQLITKLLRIGPAGMKDVIFNRQPSGKVLDVEFRMDGAIGPFKFCGMLDLLMETQGKVIIYDYKTTAAKPNVKSFPIRQFVPYIKMTEDRGIKVSGVGAMYILKKEAAPLTKSGALRKGSQPHQPAIPHYLNIDENRALYQSTLDSLISDMANIQECLNNGVFMRNRRSKFCPCEAAAHCNSECVLDAYVSKNGVRANERKEPVPDDNDDPESDDNDGSED